MPQPILFLTNSELGQASVSLAVAHEFLLRPSYTVHISSFAPLSPEIDHLNTRAKHLSPEKNPTSATFHALPGPSMKESYLSKNPFPDSFDVHGLGFWNALRAYRRRLPDLLAPWTGPEYVGVYHECFRVIRGVKPVVVVLDPLFMPAVDACRVLGVLFVVLSPNTVKEHAVQPWLRNLWRFPIVCSGYPYPLPLHLIPPNTILALTLALTLSSSTTTKALTSYRNTHGIPGPTPRMDFPRTKTPILVPTHPTTDFPCHVPEKFTLCGPILRPYAPLEKEYPELAAWMALRPTVVVNMGSHVRYTAKQERAFAEGLSFILDKRRDVQVLWKLMRVEGVERDESAVECLRDKIVAGRVRIEAWLGVEPGCVLGSGWVCCVVHHGGANAFQEGARAGVPQVVLPVWFDTYDFAWRVEYLGIGVWGSRGSAPVVEAGELGRALVRVLASRESVAMAGRARALAGGLEGEGRVVACERIVELVEQEKGEK